MLEQLNPHWDRMGTTAQALREKAPVASSNTYVGRDRLNIIKLCFVNKHRRNTIKIEEIFISYVVNNLIKKASFVDALTKIDKHAQTLYPPVSGDTIDTIETAGLTKSVIRSQRNKNFIATIHVTVVASVTTDKAAKHQGLNIWRRRDVLWGV